MTTSSRLIILMLTLTLTGCGMFSRPSIIQGRDKHYLSAHSVPPLSVPSGNKNMAFHNDYPIPERHYPDSAKTVSLIPPGLNV